MTRINLAYFKRLRQNRGWTKNELGRRSGVSGSQVAVIEKTGSTREDTLAKLAKALGVEVADLVEREGHPQVMTPPPQQAPYERIPNDTGNHAIDFLYEWSRRRLKQIPEHDRIEIRNVIRKVIELVTVEKDEWRARNIKVVSGAVEAYYSAMLPPPPKEPEVEVEGSFNKPDKGKNRR